MTGGIMSQHTVQVDVGGVTRLLATNLYSDPDVFLRELIQNGHDAILKRDLLSSPTGNGQGNQPRIRITIDESKSTLSVEDNGAGLSEAEVHSYLATIGASDKPDLRRQIAARNLTNTRDLIGQFGIGLLSAFIVADRIDIYTRSQSEHAWHWSSTGGREYSLEPAEREAVGTTVILQLNPQQRRYLRYEKLRDIIKKYSDFIGIPIHLGSGGEPVNAVHAPWHRTHSTDDERRLAHRAYWATRFRNEIPLAIFPLNEAFEVIDPVTDERSDGRVQGILGITDRHLPGIDTRGTVDIYVNRVFVASANREAIPSWAGFVQGVIECGELTPNAARDNVVNNNVLFSLRDYLGRFVVRRLGELASKDINRFKDIMSWHHYQVVGMCVQDESDKGRLSLREYLASATLLPDNRRVVYYITEPASESQFYMLCQARGLSVFNAAGMFTRQFLERFQRTWPERIHLSRIDVATSDTIFEPISLEERKQFEALEVYASSLRCTARVSRFLPKEVPALLSKSRDSDTRDEMQAIAEAFHLPDFIRDSIKKFLAENKEPLTLHLNSDNAIIRLLARRLALGDDLAKNSLVSIYNNAIMLNSRNITPENIRIMFNQYNQVIGDLLESAARIEDLERARQALFVQLQELTAKTTATTGRDRWVTCFVAMPFDRPEIAPVYAALERVLEDVPFLWNVVKADESHRDARLWKSVNRLMAGSHCFIAEVSEHNPNVMIEIGRMEAFDRPLLLLKREGSADLPADLRERLYVTYSGDGQDLIDCLREEIKKNENFCRQSGEPFLSKTFLMRESGLGEAVCGRIAERYPSCQDFLNAKADEVEAALQIRSTLVTAAHDAVASVLKRIGRAVPQ
jgi:molecular chaperone HtpG